LVDRHGELRCYRVGSTDTLRNRLFVWRIIRLLADGIHPNDMPLGRARPDHGLLTGLLELTPAAIMCSPLIARHQPLAAVLMCSNGAEVVVVSADGSGWLRPIVSANWPVGTGRPSLSGTGIGIYRSGINALPGGHAHAVLTHAVAGGNALLGYLTDPATFRDDNGYLDVDEQLITWSDVRFGFDAINSIAADWHSPESIWAAFRALTTLQGVWDGQRRLGVPLSDLLVPANLLAGALPAIKDPIHHGWAASIIDNYELELRKGFPDATIEQAARHMQELRNLVHGVGSHANRRHARLPTLRMMDNHAPNVQLVRDIASLWWIAVLLEPRRVLRPGRAPWEP
jgi:hypothetical protein